MAIGNLITVVQSFMGGMARSLSKLLVPVNKYFDAQNVTYLPESEGSEGGLSGALGTELSFERENIQITSDSEDYKAYKILLNLDFGIVHEIIYTLPAAAPVTLTISSTNFTQETRYADLITQINADPFLSAFIVPIYAGETSIYIGVRGYGANYFLTETIDGESSEVVIIKEFYGTAGNGQMYLLKSMNIGDNQYMLESNGAVFKWTVFNKNPVTGSLQYVTLLETNTIIIPTTSVIDIDGEINNGNKVSIYFTGTGIDPRVLYVQLQDTWIENSAMQYDVSFGVTENEEGYYTYSNLSPISKLQILENFARAELASVNDSGGALTTGSKMYMIRQSIGLDNATGFYFYSNPVPIFLDSLTNTRLNGDVSGLLSNKSITLNIKGLNPSLYDYFELICVENNDGVISATIVGQYPISSETQQITHSGFEEVSSITIAELSRQEIVIKGAGNLVITRNRLFLSNITLAQQPNLAIWAKTIPVETKRTTIPAIGNLYDNVAEYQDPSNVNGKAGYIIKETYRGAIILFFNGVAGYRGVSQPYVIGDFTIDTSVIGSELVNNNGVDPPTEVYVYYPQFRVDISTVSVDGIPLNELVYGYQIVRLPCIPEVLAMGLAMPASENGQPTLTDYYTAGSSVVTGTYSVASSSSRRTQISFLSPDILFGSVNITPLQGDRLFNYGQVYQYNSINEIIFGPQRTFFLYEFGDAYDPNVAPYSPVQHIMSQGELVPFNTDGLIEINGAKLRNLVSYTFAGIVNNVFGNNQKSLAIELSDFMNKLNSFTDRGLYLTQYVRFITDKYGPENQGNYISCGHFRQVEEGTSFYIDDVFGGDAFTEKSFIKFCNFYSNEPTNAAAGFIRNGISIYTQNRGNYQLRNFTAGSTGDYPYTTTSLQDWLNINDQLEGQLLYSLSYTPTTLLLPKLVYDPSAPFVSEETSTIRYSQLKLENSLLDSYRQFLPLDFKAFPSVYGAIKNTFSNGNSIIVMMERYICSQQVDLQQQQTDPNNQTTIIIGDGTVLGARESDISFIGAPIKTGAIQYLSKFGKRYFAWWNPFYKKVIIHTGEQLIDLGADNSMETFFVQNTQFSTSERSFFFTYDFYTSELLCIASYALPEVFGWVDTDTYTKGQKVFINGSFSNKTYYIATANVPAGKDPLDIANFGLFWEPYRQSNFVLSYNERLNNPCSFYNYTPAYPMMMYRNTILSSPTSSLLLQNVYEHNIMTGKWYEDTIISYVTSIVNANPDDFKTAINVRMDSNQKPIAIYLKSNSGNKTYGVESDIKQIRNYWWSVIKNDARITTANPLGLNSKLTAQIGGEFIEATIFFKNSDGEVNTITSVIMNVNSMPPNMRAR